MNSIEHSIRESKNPEKWELVHPVPGLSSPSIHYLWKTEKYCVVIFIESSNVFVVPTPVYEDITKHKWCTSTKNHCRDWQELKTKEDWNIYIKECIEKHK